MDFPDLKKLFEGVVVEAAEEAASLLDYDFRLPLEVFGYRNIPAYPFNVGAIIDTLIGLAERKAKVTDLHQRLSREYTIGGRSALARDFLFGSASSSALLGPIEALKDHLVEVVKHKGPGAIQDAITDMVRGGVPGAEERFTTEPLTALSLDEAKQFEIAWTENQNIFTNAQPHLAPYADAVTSADHASRCFWPMIADHGHAYNLLILRKLSAPDLDPVKIVFGEVWQLELASLDPDELYLIDLRIVGSVKAVKGAKDVFTPATMVLMRRDPASKELTPVAVNIANPATGQAVTYTRGNATEAAWIYALEAARTSVTIWGIAIGHVYHWHLATASLLMTWRKTVSEGHGLHRLIAPHAKHTIGFDDVLLLLWGQIVPPMSIGSGLDFLGVADRFARGRTFFDDDPPATIARLGLRQEDFTKEIPWDLFPVIQYQMRVWVGVTGYVQVFVDHFFATDEIVADDADLQAWVRASADPGNGNIVGLGSVQTRAELSEFLLSLLFRVIMHGISRLNETAYPALAFVSNYPTCLNGQDIPAPTATSAQIRLLDRLPYTGQIGQILSFYDIFVFTEPYESFVPKDVDVVGPFSHEPDHPCHAALHELQKLIAEVVEDYQKLPIDQPVQQQQWPWCIEL